MFDVGFWELSLIFIIALIVLGPERLPRVARDVGLWVGRMRRYVSTVREDIERAVHDQELRELVTKPKELDELYDVVKETKGTLDQAKRTLSEAEREGAKAPAAKAAAAKPAAGDSAGTSNGDSSSNGHGKSHDNSDGDAADTPAPAAAEVGEPATAAVAPSPEPPASQT